VESEAYHVYLVNPQLSFNPNQVKLSVSVVHYIALPVIAIPAVFVSLVTMQFHLVIIQLLKALIVNSMSFTLMNLSQLTHLYPSMPMLTLVSGVYLVLRVLIALMRVHQSLT